MIPLPRRHSATVVLAVAVAVASVAGCGGDEDNEEAGKSASATSAVEIKDFKFLPAEIEVTAGTTVRWTNADEASHTATSDESGVFDTGTIRTDEAGTVTLEEPGTIGYHCDFHPFMKATITVR